MIQIYTQDGGIYHLQGQYEKCGTHFYIKMNELLRIFPAQKITITKNDDILKRKLELLEDGV